MYLYESKLGFVEAGIHSKNSKSGDHRHSGVVAFIRLRDRGCWEGNEDEHTALTRRVEVEISILAREAVLIADRIRIDTRYKFREKEVKFYPLKLGMLYEWFSS